MLARMLQCAFVCGILCQGSLQTKVVDWRYRCYTPPACTAGFKTRPLPTTFWSSLAHVVDRIFRPLARPGSKRQAACRRPNLSRNRQDRLQVFRVVHCWHQNGGIVACKNAPMCFCFRDSVSRIVANKSRKTLVISEVSSTKNLLFDVGACFSSRSLQVSVLVFMFVQPSSSRSAANKNATNRAILL